MKPINTLCGQNTELFVIKEGGTIGLQRVNYLKKDHGFQLRQPVYPALTNRKLTNSFHGIVFLEQVKERSANQEIRSLLWNVKVHYHVHRSPPLVLSEPHESNAIPKIHFNIIHPSTHLLQTEKPFFIVCLSLCFSCFFVLRFTKNFSQKRLILVAYRWNLPDRCSQLSALRT
jgi:hypothetical protein